MTDPTGIKIEYDPTVQMMRGVTIHGNKPFDVPYISRISGNLWQGGCHTGLLLPKFFRNVVSLYPWERYKLKHELDSILVVRMLDDDNIIADQVLAVAEWTASRLAEGPTLVHCQAGLNRSSLIAALVLILTEDMTGPEAIEFLREVRSPAVLCNKAFEEFVRDFKFVEPLIG